MSRTRKAHVIEERWQTGGFHVVRHIRCRCGWTAEHYNAGALREAFQQHARDGADDEPDKEPR